MPGGIAFDPNLTYTFGFTYYSFIYTVPTVIYSIFGLWWIYQSRVYPVQAKSLQVFGLSGILLCIAWLENAFQSAAIISVELGCHVY